eukprot:XP_027311304.1 sterile alpha motif domain-containing protein 12 isoform X2 [Anas platyrhynchos]
MGLRGRGARAAGTVAAPSVGSPSCPRALPDPHMDTEAQDGAEVQDGAEALSEGCSLAEVSEGPPAQWSVPEVCAWLDARCGDGDLVQLAAEHGVSGRALLRMTEGTLRRMGVAPRSRRRELLRELLGLRLQQELEELLSIAGE